MVMAWLPAQLASRRNVLDRINHVFDADADHGVAGVTALLHKGRIVLIGDTLVATNGRMKTTWPTSQRRAAVVARHMGLEPRVAFVSFSTFGYPVSERAEKMHVAPTVLDQRGVDFEYEGEMTVDVALNERAQRYYPFQRLTGPANILIVPARHSAFDLGQADAGDGRCHRDRSRFCPVSTKPIQICSTTSTTNDILNMAVLAACNIG